MRTLRTILNWTGSLMFLAIALLLLAALISGVQELVMYLLFGHW